MRGLVFAAIVFSLLVLAAHFLRDGNLAFVVVSLAIIGLVAVRKSWARRVLQVTLTLGFLEWMRLLLARVEQRLAAGEPWERLAMILGAVAVVSALTVLGLESRPLREHFDRAGDHPEPPTDRG